MLKKVILFLLLVGFVAGAALGILLITVSSSLPKLVKIEDYQPLLVSEVYDVNGERIGEFYRERRRVVPFEQIPKQLVQAFLAAEDSSFYEHGGINYFSILRATIANLKAGRKVQGGSTITQQVARSLMLSSEKTYTRKVREILLSYQMESNLAKEQILFLYLNQIYFGHSAYGVELASQSYFHKSVQKLTLPEMAMLAGMPQAPSAFSPFANPKMAKQRQRYVLRRMVEENFITEDQYEKAVKEPLTLYARIDFKEVAPHFVETIRQYLVQELGEEMVLDKGLKIETTLSLKHQLKAQDSVREGLRQLDKRQGYRGPEKNLAQKDEITKFLSEEQTRMIREKMDVRLLLEDGEVVEKGTVKLSEKPKGQNLPNFLQPNEISHAVVTAIDDSWGYVKVALPGAQALIDFETMKWARTPNPEVRDFNDPLRAPSKALKVGDVIQVRIKADKFQSEKIQEKLAKLRKAQKNNTRLGADLPIFAEHAQVELEQEPIAEAALLSIDHRTGQILAMVGGYDFKKSELNRALQAVRQTGSSFKPFVYLAGLEGGYVPSTPIMDAPIVYEDPKLSNLKDTEPDDQPTKWKPGNYNSKFGGDILFRNALIRSKNIPTIRILEAVGVDKVALYAKRLGVFSPMNMDLSLGLGSSSVTLYEMTRAFAVFGNSGRKVKPKMLLSVKDHDGKELLGEVLLDARFKKELQVLDEEMEAKRKTALEELQKQKENLSSEEQVRFDNQRLLQAKAPKSQPQIFFDDPEQLLSPQTAYLMTSLLQGVIRDPGGTGGKARELGKTAAGKTGTTNSYFDAWFIAYTPQITTGVWVGHDKEKSMGVGETGGTTALPIWLEYMKMALENVPERDFPVPQHILFANIDNETGRLASTSSRQIIRQAYLEGTEPGSQKENSQTQEEQKDFIKEDLSE